MTLSAPETFTTERLILRRSRLSDAEDIFAYASDRQTIRYMDYGPRANVAEIVNVLKGRPAEWQAGNFSWVTTVKPSDRAVGSLSCVIETHAASFGYLLNRQHWGQGYGTEAARAIVDWAIQQPQIYRVWATCDVDNLASIRVLEKCGLVQEGKLRRYLVRPNISPFPRDAFIYARVRD